MRSAKADVGSVESPSESYSKYWGNTADQIDSSSEAKKLNLSFKNAPWKDVLQRIADQSNLSLSLDHVPAGTFTFQALRTYSSREAVDLINGALYSEGYGILKGEGNQLHVIDFEEDGERVGDILQETPFDDLDKLADFELAKCRFQGASLGVIDDVKQLIGPFGKVTVLRSSNQLLVIDIGKNLRDIREAISRRNIPHTVDDPLPAPGQPDSEGGSEQIRECIEQHNLRAVRNKRLRFAVRENISMQMQFAAKGGQARVQSPMNRIFELTEPTQVMSIQTAATVPGRQPTQFTTHYENAPEPFDFVHVDWREPDVCIFTFYTSALRMQEKDTNADDQNEQTGRNTQSSQRQRPTLAQVASRFLSALQKGDRKQFDATIQDDLDSDYIKTFYDCSTAVSKLQDEVNQKFGPSAWDTFNDKDNAKLDGLCFWTSDCLLELTDDIAIARGSPMDIHLARNEQGWKVDLQKTLSHHSKKSGVTIEQSIDVMRNVKNVSRKYAARVRSDQFADVQSLDEAVGEALLAVVRKSRIKPKISIGLNGLAWDPVKQRLVPGSNPAKIIKLKGKVASTSIRPDSTAREAPLVVAIANDPDVLTLRRAQECQVVLDGIPNSTYRGHIKTVITQRQSDSNANPKYEVTVVLESWPELLKEELTASIDLRIPATGGNKAE